MTVLKTFLVIFISTLMISGCSWLGLSDDEPEMAAEPNMQEEAEMVAEIEEPMGPTPEELLAEKDQALVTQGMRIAAMQSELGQLKEENSNLQQELQAARLEALEKQKMLDEQTEEMVQSAASTIASIPRETAPDGGYGLHLASYRLRENIAPGLKTIEKLIPVLAEGRPVKIATANVKGTDYFRLILGQFDSQAAAAAECKQALLLVDFCEVVAFQGEDF